MYSDEGLSRIYDRTSGYCHICRKKLSLTNYGRYGCRGAWEVEHSMARANGDRIMETISMPPASRATAAKAL